MGILDALVETPQWVKLLLWMAVLATDAGIQFIIGFSIIQGTLGWAISVLSGFFGVPIPAFSGAELLLITIALELIYLTLTVFLPAASAAKSMHGR